MAKPMFCLRCYSVGKAKTVTKGSIIIELFLWLMLLFPGLPYTIWRLTTRHQACRSCGASELVPSDSQRARMAMAQQTPPR